MMKRYIKSMVSALLVFAIILSTYIPVVAVSETSDQPNYSSYANSGKRDVVATTLNTTGALEYYGDNYSYDKLSTQSSTQLLDSLSTLMRSTHTTITTYDDCRDYAYRTDCENEAGASISNQSDKTLVLLYTSYTATMGQYNGWNREHVWPQSLGIKENTPKGGGADLHHVRPADAGVNSSRNNKMYGYAGSNPSEKYGTNPAVGVLGGTFNSTYFEPLDNVKGDVARIILYVWVRWGSDWGADDVTEVFQSVDVLLEWCKLDPVDTWEMGRNKVVENIQGNRNVFIDYPEYAWLIFGREVPTDMKTPSGEAAKGSGNQGGTTTPGGDTTDPGNGGTTTPGGDNTGSDDPVVTPDCSHSFTVKKNATTADCYNDGYTGDVYCARCNTLITEGSVIPSSSVHKYTNWEMTDDGVYVRHCTICNVSVELSIDSVVGSIDSDAKKILILLALGATDSVLFDALSR